MTALQRILDRLPDEHREPFLRLVNDAGLREDSPDLHILALEHEARWGAVEAMRTERQRMAGMLSDLPEAMRAASIPIVNGLAAETKSAVTAGIREDLRSEYREVFQQLVDATTTILGEADKKLIEVSAAAKSVSDVAKTEIAATSEAMSKASNSLAIASLRVGGWTSSRVATVAIGIALAVGMFAAGTITHAADVVFGCPSRVEHVGDVLHLSAHNLNIVRNYICKGS